MDMLTGYAASHQHPINLTVHMVGIPTIMLGVLIPLSWVSIEIVDFRFDLAQALVVGMSVFYFTLDKLFSVAFLILGWLIAMLAAMLGELPLDVSGTIAAAAFFGGYLAQFIGHAIERSMPVLIKHPIQANLAAPFFVVVELFKMLGLRDKLFNEVQERIAELRQEQAAGSPAGS
jgi:uncharacterized membrane protein YGL010W